MATKGKHSVAHLSSMFSVDKVLLGECSMLNTELVIAKIQKQIFHIPDFNVFLLLPFPRPYTIQIKTVTCITA
jgi:hypothetical protein